MKLVSVSYAQSRLNFFREQLAAANRRLDYYGKKGFYLVSTQMIQNKYGCQIMYLFFVRHTEDNCKLPKG